MRKDAVNGERCGNAAEKRRLPRLNFRPLVFCAVGMCFGIFVYMRVRFGGLVPSDFLFFGGLFLLALFPLSLKRLLSLALCVLLFAGLGAGLSHLYAERYFTGEEGGMYEVEGTVSEFAVYNGRTDVVLSSLTLNGERCGGKLRATVLSEGVRAGDVLRFKASVKRVEAPSSGNFYEFTEDIRYTAGDVSLSAAERGGDLFLRLNGSVYDVLTENLRGEEAELSYALLTGNTRGMDTGVLRSVRQGGIAHIFAVSGLHIGIVYAAAALLFRPLKRWGAFPAVAVAFCYAAMCGFSVSALRAAIMCAAHAVCVFLHRKTDFLNAIGLAAVAVLLIFPAEWLTAGFRLSFGACLGLALFSGTLSRGMKRLHCPAPVASVFAASVSVQLFLFPVLFESFGYVSVWGTLLNLVLVPLLPVIFLGVLIPVLLSLLIPPAAAVFLALPNGLMSALLAVLSELDVSLVLTGFSLGGGATVWLAACAALSERFRAARPLRLTVAGFFCVLFAVCVVLRNVVFAGCVIRVGGDTEANCALVRTPGANVLVIGGDASLSDCRDLLARNYGGTLDAVIVTGEGTRALNAAVFLGAEAVYAPLPLATGLQETSVQFAREVSVGGMLFRYETESTLVLLAEGVAVEFDFEEKAELAADFAVERGSADLNFYLRRGIIKSL